MKLNKKTTLSLFLAGTMLFSSMALADVLIGSGYGGVKQALKTTAKILTEDTDSFTTNAVMEVKYDGKILGSEDQTTKLDVKNNRRWNYYKQDGWGGPGESEYYTDAEKSISGNAKDGYYQTNFTKKQPDFNKLTNPFDEEYAADVEKVADAFVSNMKDFVQVKEENGGKLYFGSMDSAQLPAFASALSSVIMKYSVISSFERRVEGVEEISDVYLAEVNGKAFQNGDGLLENVMGYAKAIATDKKGGEHTFEFTVGFTVSDVNSTVVTAPKVPEENITEGPEADIYYGRLYADRIGEYRCSIMNGESGKRAAKVGDGVLVINAADGDKISGHITITSPDENIDSDFTAEFNEPNNIYVGTCAADGKLIGFDVDGYMNQYAEIILVRTDIKEVGENNMIAYGGENRNKMFIRQY